MKDYRHASRLYFDDNFKLAPKHKYLYHVVFDLDETVVGTSRPFTNNEKIQYNKKMYLATRIGYEPVNVTFHDDNADTVNAFWKTYYEYHIADSINTVPSMRNLNRDTAYDSNITRTQFGMDTAVSRKKPFLRGIDIFVLHKQRFTSFSLINPIIGSWAHDTLDQTDGQGLLQNTMQVFYETVLYKTGLVKGDGVPGFATLHYDKSPSPLTVLGGGTNSIFGPGGVVDGIGSVIRNVQSGNILGAILSASNTYNNAKKIKKAGVKEELKGIAKKGVLEIGKQAGTITNPVAGFAVGASAVAAGVVGSGVEGLGGQRLQRTALHRARPQRGGERFEGAIAEAIGLEAEAAQLWACASPQRLGQGRRARVSDLILAQVQQLQRWQSPAG